MLALKATNLCKAFGSGAKRVDAVKGVSLSIASGETLAFLGRNGAGKTTTIKMIAGLLHPDSGTVEIDGLRHSDRNLFTKLGCVLEGSRNLYMQLTAMDNLEYFAALKGMSGREGRRRGLELLDMFGLSHKANNRVRELSRGMQQKVSVAVSLVHRPSLLLLDEPTNGLDVESSEHIKQMLKACTAEGLAVLLTTHQLDVAQEVSERVAVIRDGELIADESTESLLGRFSGTTVEIRLGEPVQAGNPLLAELGAGVSEDRRVLTLDAGDERLYQVLEAVRPLPILAVQRQTADLTDVFLNIVQGEEVTNV